MGVFGSFYTYTFTSSIMWLIRISGVNRYIKSYVTYDLYIANNWFHMFEYQSTISKQKEVSNQYIISIFFIKSIFLTFKVHFCLLSSGCPLVDFIWLTVTKSKVKLWFYGLLSVICHWWARISNLKTEQYPLYC